MNSTHDDIGGLIITLLSLLKHPVTAQEVQGLLGSELIRETFPECARLDISDYLNPGNVETAYAGVIAYSEAHHTYTMRDALQSETLARTAIRNQPRLAGVISSRVPWQSRPDAPETLLRDIRNYFYANDANGVRQRLEVYCRMAPDGFLKGYPFMFLLAQLDARWLGDADRKLLALTCEQLLPLAASRLLDTAPFEALLRRQKPEALGESALLSIIDNCLLRGDIPEGERLLEQCSSAYAVELRRGWIAFLKGDFGETIRICEALLQKLRSATGRNDIYFQSVGGIFLVFSLIRRGGEDALRRAYGYAALGMKVPYIGDAYSALHAYLGRQLNRRNATAADYPENPDMNALSRFFCLVCGLWEVGSEEMGAAAGQLSLEAASAYPWVSRECARIASACDVGDETPSGEGDDSADGSVVACVPLQPRWSRMLSALTGLLRTGSSEVSYRLCWFCSYDEQRDECVRLRPVEQRTSKNGGWSKGRSILIAKIAETRAWPDYFTLQDQQMCTLIWEDRQRINEVEKHGGSFASLKAVEAAIGHPLLFWDMPQPQPFHCRRTRPVLRITEENGRIGFAVSPKPPADGGRVTIVRDASSDLEVYSFGKRHLELADIMKNGIRVPKGHTASIASFISLAAQEMTLLSETTLDFLSIQPQPTSGRVHFRLQPHDSRMTVELFMLPFPSMQEPCSPGIGPAECICFENGRLMRYTRDFDAELDAMREAMSACDCLDETTRSGGYTWELASLEQCYLFILSLQGILDKVTVHWPENHRLKVQRRVTIGDVTLSCKPNSNWLYSLDGDVRLDDGMVVSFRELLKAARREHGNFIRLDDGQIVALADAFRKRLDDLVSVTSETGDDEVIFNRFALPYLELVTGDMPVSAASVKPLAERIRQAMDIEPKVPDGLQATLRPYQNEGFVWLSRLDAWGAGACLADDMGLGKTIQSIAFILLKTSEGPSLVVAPTSVCSNWLQEFAKFAPSLKLISFGGNHRNDLFNELGPGCVMVTSYGLLQSEEASFCKVNWRVAILDEAQAIKNHNAKRSRAVVGLKAQFRVVTTGTPVENNLGELWSIFNFINPGLLGSYEEFQSRFAVPIERTHNHDVLERLSKIVHPFILRRIKSQVLTDLPPKTEIQLHIELSQEEKAFYEALRQQLLDEIRGLGKDGTPGTICIQVIAAIIKLRQAACNPRLINERLTIPSSKLQAFSELLDELVAGGHKVLVFSQFVKHLALVRPVLEGRGIKYQYLDGNTPVEERRAAVDAFQSGEGDVFLISLRAGGFGLNLTAADYVIHLDPWWNPAVEDQASDRAHRIGQSKSVTIYRLIAKNTIEDKILQLHHDKRDLAESILDGTDSASKLSQDELLNLLTIAGLDQ